MLRSSRVAARFAASEEGLSSMKSANYFTNEGMSFLGQDTLWGKNGFVNISQYPTITASSQTIY
jgi:hypothetical protein